MLNKTCEAGKSVLVTSNYGIYPDMRKLSSPTHYVLLYYMLTSHTLAMQIFVYCCIEKVTFCRYEILHSFYASHACRIWGSSIYKMDYLMQKLIRK